ncbi:MULTISPECIES: hypothetical protein [Bacillaceae]|uniref:Uncharacterized protein n=1 Tax=Domibacillus aminovorans TaxID=29332 RepID=A0A177L1X4_9BACI|nr:MULTISPECIES: hypothetical protein [Bacillaceae]OAH59628.1 hypothetical protein AWH48_00545 [Domibacillus aminovorans]
MIQLKNLNRFVILFSLIGEKKKQKIVSLSNEVLENMGDTEHLKREDQLDLLQTMDEIEEKYKTVLLLRFGKQC